MSKRYTLERHELGFWHVQPPPTLEELRAFYLDMYYPKQEADQKILQYASDYDALELEHKRIAGMEALRVLDRSPGSMLEIGVGEGFFLDEFHRAGWTIQGVDFTLDAVARWKPHLTGSVTAADIGEYLATQSTEGAQFDFIALNNVIEHVLDPVELMARIRALLTPSGMLRVAMPNEASWIQRSAVALGNAENEFWVMPPEHLNYFDVASGTRILEHCGFRVADLLADFPIDLFLLSKDTAYTLNRGIGHAAHEVRLRFETELAQRSIDQLIAFRSGCAASGVGRNLIFYARAD